MQRLKEAKNYIKRLDKDEDEEPENEELVDAETKKQFAWTRLLYSPTMNFLEKRNKMAILQERARLYNAVEDNLLEQIPQD